MAADGKLIDTWDRAAVDCGAWLYDRATGDSRALGEQEYALKFGVYGFHEDVPVERVFVLLQDRDGRVRLLP